VVDPVYNPNNINGSPNNTFGDILRRETCMNAILASNAEDMVQCDGAGNRTN
jgi:hypothetical protein